MSRALTHLLVAALALAAVLILVARGGTAPVPAAGADAPLTVGFDPPSGLYRETIHVRMAAPAPGTAVYFTTDGSVPAPDNGTLYTEPLALSPGTAGVVALRAAAVDAAGQAGPVAAAAYAMGLKTAVPIISLTIDPDDLWNSERGIFANPLFTGAAWERPADLAFFEANGSGGFSSPLGVRVHGGRSREDEKKSLRFYFRGEYGPATLDYPLFPDSEKHLFKRLVLHNGGQDYPAVSVNATLLRNHLTGELAREAGGFATHTRPVLVYLNGALWGIYNLRERIDDRYLAENFQIADPDLLVGFEHDLQASYGDLQHWQGVQEFVAAHDLRDPEHLATLQTQINLANFIDYNLFQIITANADWPHSNQLKFREREGGQWHWMFWDSDYAFGLMPDSYIEKDMFERVLQQEDALQQEAALLLEKLLQNAEFRNRFLVRLSDLLNTVFVPQKVAAQVTRLAEGLAQDIVFETIRWPGTGDWGAAVDYMLDFARRRPDVVRRQAVAQFGLPGTAVLTVGTPVDGRGAVRLNQDILLQEADLPWSGEYFQGLTLAIEALPAPGYVFAGWEGLPAAAQAGQTAFLFDENLIIRPRFAPRAEAASQAGAARIAAYGAAGADAPISGLQGDWVLLEVRAGGLDLRGWRVTDNDSVTAVDEGSLILTDDPALAHLPAGSRLLLLAAPPSANAQLLSTTALPPGWIAASAGNGLLDISSDPWFSLGSDDNLALLAPGATSGFEDDLALDFLLVGQGEPGQSAADFGLAPERVR